MTTTRRPPAAPALRRVTARMRALGTALPARDGVAVFNRVYLAVTEEIARQGTAGLFQDPSATSRLAAGFAGRYLTAVDDAEAGRHVPACWRPLFQARRHPGVLPVQFALAKCRK